MSRISGFTLTEEHKRKIGLANKGKKRTDEVKSAHRQRMLGTKLSEETKRKMSLAHKGKRPYEMTDEIRVNMSNAQKGKKKAPRSKQHRINSGISRKGVKSHLWRGGLTKPRTVIRNCVQYKLWREAIFERDNFTCVLCYARGGRIEADHYPISFSSIIDILLKNCSVEALVKASLEDKLIWDTNNGRTLCRECHRKTDNFGGNSIKKK